MLGRTLVLVEAQRRLATNAVSAEQAAESYAADARHQLAAMNASPFAFCSAAELGYFRRLLYESAFLKEAGRMHNGHIACSAVVGSTALPRMALNPGVLQPDGVKLYWDIPAFRMGMQPMVAVQLGDSYVVTDFRIRREGVPAPVHLNVHMIGAVGPRIDSARNSSSDQFARDGQATIGGILYATRCSVRYSHCVTASISEADALSIDYTQLGAVMALSGLAGSAFGLTWSFLYDRNCSTERQLRRALVRDKLDVAYQPIVDLSTGRRVGAEALARWISEDGRPVGPEVFVPIAERRGFVGEITRRVLNRSLRDFVPILRGNPDFRLSVNVAASDLSDPAFLPMLDSALESTGFPRRNLVIELTETSTADRAAAVETIRQLRQNGHKVHIDDFGTGYSSLSYLKDLAVDAIKIDRSFTQSIGTDCVTVTLLPQILAMAEALSLQVVVEGIETAEQAAYFAGSQRPILAQGWLFGPAVPLDQFLIGLNPVKSLRGYEEELCEDETGYALPSSAG